MRVTRSLPLLLLLLSLAGTGCLFSPDEKPPKPVKPIVYKDPTSPVAVLENMITAYVNRDSVQTELVYDDNYAGASNDPSGIVGSFTTTKAVEVRHVGALRLSTSIVSVFLDLGNPAAWSILPPLASDPPDWVEIQINNQTIAIQTQSGSGLESTNQTLTYTFKPTEESPTRTTWKIIRWTELVTNPPTP